MTTAGCSICLSVALCCLFARVIPGCGAKAQTVGIPVAAEYFGTKGRYEEVNAHLISDILAVNKSLFKPPSEDCRAVHVSVIIRHGTRYPTAKNIRKMQAFHKLVQTEARSSEPWVQQLRHQWKMWYTEDMDGKLVEKGRDDHRHLALRLATSVPSLVSEENLRGARFRFITSSKHRCVDSIVAFKGALQKHWNITDVDFHHEINDDLMRFFDQCERFVEDVENNKTALREVDIFKSGEEMKTVQDKIADRLEVPHEFIESDMVEAAYFLCAYEFAIKTENSLWCKLFDEGDAKVMEYQTDLKQYWKRSYGYDINRKSSCPLFHDLFNRLTRVANEIRFGQVSEAVTVQVGHAETLIPLLTLLDFYKDEDPLTAAGFSTQQERLFRSGRIVPYVANLLFVLYSCDEGVRVQVLLNENPLHFPGVSSATPLLSTVRERYSELLNGCDFNIECELKPHNCSKCSEL